MAPKVAVFSTLSAQQKEVFYQYFIENDTKFTHNPKSNTYIATIISPANQTSHGPARSSSTGASAASRDKAEKDLMQSIMSEYGSLVPVLGCKPSIAQTNMSLDITSLLRFMTYVYEEHFHEFFGAAQNIDQPSFLRDDAAAAHQYQASLAATGTGSSKVSINNKRYYNFVYFILRSRSLAIYKSSLPPNSAGPNMASLIWIIISNLNKYKANSVFVSAFLMLLTSTHAPSHVLGLFTTLQHELKQQIVLASHTQLQAKPLIQLASKVLDCEIRTQAFISTLVDHYNNFLNAGLDSTVFSREFLIFVLEAANREEPWTQIQEDSLRHDDSLPGHLSTRNNESFLHNEKQAIMDVESPTDKPGVFLGKEAKRDPTYDSNPLLTKLAAESPVLSKNGTPVSVATAASAIRIPDSAILTESRLKRTSTMTRSRASGFYGLEDDDDQVSSVSQSGFRRRMIMHEDIYPASFNTTFMIDETSFVSLQEGLAMILPPVVTLFCEKFDQAREQTDENLQLLVKELMSTIGSSPSEMGSRYELVLQRSLRELLRTEVHTPKIIMKFVKNLLCCLGERLGLAM